MTVELTDLKRKLLKLEHKLNHPETYLTKKDWLKLIRSLNDLYTCETLITEIEAKKAKLEPDFKSRIP